MYNIEFNIIKYTKRIEDPTIIRRNLCTFSLKYKQKKKETKSYLIKNKDFNKILKYPKKYRKSSV